MAKDPRFNRKSASEERREEPISGKEIFNNTITTNHIQNGAITPEKTNFLYNTGNNTITSLNPLWSFFAIKGTRLYTDENFASTSNSINVYNNAGGTAVTHARKNSGFLDSGVSPVPNSTGYVIEIKHAPTTSDGVSPYYGGWFFGVGTYAGRQLLCVFTMKVPLNRFLSWHSNSIGDNGNTGWLTSNAGTGKFETYAYYVNCGTSGTFSTTMFFAVYGGDTGTFYTYISSATVYDLGQR